MLTPGINKIKLDLHRFGRVQVEDSLEISVNYIPLLQLPPLHLAIFVTKDSPLLIDCPPAKYGGISAAHSSLYAAISKFRMSAYMWQALMADDFHQKRMGRRSFRLDEEWAVNTTMQVAHQAGPNDSSVMGMVPKVHIIQCEKSIAEIRNMRGAQQRACEHHRDTLHKYFENALLNSSGPFQPRSHPVVLGLILDAHYSADQAITLGHVEPGCHNPQGISLGIFGSNSTYSWPRFLQEVPTYLNYRISAENVVENDNSECDTRSDAFYFGQCAFLHQVGHAFGAGHTTGIMAKENTKSWALNFLDHKLNSEMNLDAKWNIRDAIRFISLPHFALPEDHDLFMTEDFKNAAVKIEVITRTGDGLYHSSKSPPSWDIESDIIRVTCAVGLAHVQVQNGEEESDKFYDMRRESSWHFIFPGCYNPKKPLKIAALGMNGKEHTVTDVWALLEESSYVLIPGSTVRLRKRSARSDAFEIHDKDFVHWALLLRRRGKDGRIWRATSIDLHVGDVMNGIVVHYADGHHEARGPVLEKDTGPYTSFHASQHHCDLPANENITKVVICRGEGEHESLLGIRMTLSNGVHWGRLNTNNDHDIDVNSEYDVEEYVPVESEAFWPGKSFFTLEPAEDRVVVGFYGQSEPGFEVVHEFGILTAPKDVKLPDTVCDMPVFQNL